MSIMEQQHAWAIIEGMVLNVKVLERAAGGDDYLVMLEETQRIVEVPARNLFDTRGEAWAKAKRKRDAINR